MIKFSFKPYYHFLQIWFIDPAGVIFSKKFVKYTIMVSANYFEVYNM